MNMAHPPTAPRPSPWKWLGPLLGVLGLFAIGTLIAGMHYCGRAMDAGGVHAANDLPASALEGIVERKILRPGEKILSYYDASITGDGSDVAMVTTERLVYLKDGRVTAVALADIVKVDHRTESLTGDVIEAQTASGEIIKIEIAPMNSGPTFLAALELARGSKRDAG